MDISEFIINNIWLLVYAFIYLWACELIAASGKRLKVKYWEVFFLSLFLTPILGALYVLIEKKES